MMIADRPLRTTTLMDARLEIFKESKQLPLWSQGLFLIGTYEAQVRVHLIDRDTLNPGEAGVVQIHLPQPCAAQFGDRFVLRGSSGDATMGGGEILDFSPLHHRRRPEQLRERLRSLAEGNRGDFLAQEIRKRSGPITLEKLADNLNITPMEALSAANGLPADIVTFETNDKIRFFISRAAYDEIKIRCIKALENHHRENPLLEEGKTVEELCTIAGLASDAENLRFLRHVLEDLHNESRLKAVGRTWALAGHAVTPSEDFRRHVDFVERRLAAYGMQLPILTEMETAAQKAGIEKREVQQILHYLCRQGKAYGVEGSYIHESIVSKCKNLLIEKLKVTPLGITVAQFRDIVQGNRKICVPLLMLFDAEGITERSGDVRTLKNR